MLQNPRRINPGRRNQKGGDATSLPYEFYNPLAGSYPSNVPIATPVGGAYFPGNQMGGAQVGGSIMPGMGLVDDYQYGGNKNQVGGDATSLPIAYYDPIAADQCNGFFCGNPNNYIDFFYRGPRARYNARQFMNDEPFNPEGETLTGWQAPNAIPPYAGSRGNTVQEIRQRERSVIAPQGVVVKGPVGYNPRQVGGNCGLPGNMKGQQTGGGTFGAPFSSYTFGCGPRFSPNSGLSYRFNECDLQTGVSFVPL